MRTANNIRAAPANVLLESTSDNMKKANRGANNDSVDRSMDALVEVVAL